MIVAVVAILIIGGYMLSKLETTEALTEDEAIEEMFKLYPQLTEYQTETLPPSSIKAKRSPNGWYLGFIKKGSGVPGILEAQCYHITNDKYVTSVGTYVRDASTAVNNIRLESCTPMNDLEVPATTTPTVEPVPNEEPVVKTPGAPCYKSGCSGQLCTDQPDVVTTCEFKEEYACYQTATCERQANGQCGWTETPALRACLSGQAV